MASLKSMEWTARTRAITGGRPTGDGPANVPITPASALGLQYSREHGTPTWRALEDAIGDLEGGAATAFASGMGAVSAVLELLPVGAEVAVPTDSYMGTRGQLAHAERLGRLRVRRLDPTDHAAWLAAASEVDLAWLESPTNPSLHLMDIAAIAGAATDAIVAVDNTFATPLGQQPLALGADVVVHSATKLIGGHTDLLLGLAVTANDDLHARIRENRTLGGATPGALEAWLVLRGLRTLPVRLAEIGRTAALLADRLREHPAVVAAVYPGIGGMVSFDVGDAALADKLCESVRIIGHATSLGGVESTIERRGALAGEEHVPPGQLRLSVGLEDPDDLWRDLEQALQT